MADTHAPTSRLALWFLLIPTSMTLGAADLPNGPSNHAIADALRSKGAKDPEVISRFDLTKEFGTASTWTLAVVRDNVPEDPDWEDHGPIYVCFLKERSPACLDGAGSPAPTDVNPDRIPFDLLDVRIVQASSDGQNPRLLVKTCTEPSGDGDCRIDTTLYAYDKATDRFDSVFHNATAHNQNQLTRFIENGPIRGDVIATYPTTDAPYTYWVEVYRQRGGREYAQILRYRGKTEYGDGNPLAVVDSEMPETLRRLDLWKDGEPLPVPARTPAGCTTLFMRKGVEWCE